MTSNEVRQKIGMKPASDPKADELRNKNITKPEGEDSVSSITDTKKNEIEEFLTKIKGGIQNG